MTIIRRKVSTTSPDSYPLTDVIHVYLKERPGQARGIPWGVQSFVKLRDLGEYQDAQLIRQKIAACFSVFITSPTGNSVLGSKKDDRLEKVEPGIVEYLSPGEQVSFATPPGAEGYRDYTSTVLHEIAAGYGITYEAMTGDYSQVNFSSGRMGWIEMSRNVKKWQHNMMMPMVCNRVWKWFIEAAQITGQVGRDVPVKWTPPRREMIDPVKEVKGMSEEVANGFASWAEKVRENGYDPDDVIDEMQSDKAKLEAAKLSLTWMNPVQQRQPAQPPPANDDE
jgi:lambda family phage portal protein